jgi:tetratricopeptide (TPR) repeat protein
MDVQIVTAPAETKASSEAVDTQTVHTEAVHTDPLPPRNPDAPAVSVSPIVAIVDRERATQPELPTVPEEVSQATESAEKPEAVAVTKENEPEPMVLDEFDEAFFSQAEELERQEREKIESFPPVAEDLAAAAKVPPPSPALLARRSKLRKFVGAVVALGALFAVGGIGKSLVTSPASAAEAAQPAEAVVETMSATEAKPIAPPVEKKEVVEAPPAAEQPVAEDEAAEQPVAEDEAAEPEAPAEPEPAAEQPVAEAPKVDDPRTEALKLLNRGKMKDAIPMARAAIQQAPHHALGYLYLGTALQETGQHKDAIAAYSDCVRNAKKGPVWECRAMGGRK